MSNTWIRGPRCGVDNCRSRFYRSADGRRICQYGHVNEGHIDYNDDDDDFIVTKRLNIPSATPGLSQASHITPHLNKDESKRKLYGAAGRELYFKCFQCILRSQIKTIINDHGLPDVLETVVKKFYVNYISTGLLSQRTGSRSDLERDKDDDDDDDDDENYTTDQGFNTQDPTFTNDSSNESHEFQFKTRPNHIDSLALCYLGCRYLNLPIYINDFVQWTTTNRIPYMRASYNIPKPLRDKLSVDKLRLFEPKRPPFRADLCYAITKVSNCLKLDHLELNHEPLLFRLIKELVLSPQIYYSTKKFIEMRNIKLNIKQFPKSMDSTSIIYEFPELKLISIIITITKLYFTNAHLNKQQITYDWKKWKEILENLDLGLNDNRNFNNVLSSLLLSKNSSMEIIDWDEKKTNKYLDWFTHKIVNTQTTEGEPIAMKRLYDMFELPDVEAPEDEVSTTGKEINTMEIAYRQLMESKSDGSKLQDHELETIEELLIENLISNFGVTFNQLRLAIRHNQAEFVL